MNQCRKKPVEKRNQLAVDSNETTNLRMTLRGSLKLCTEADMEMARLKRQRMIHRQAAKCTNDELNVSIKIQMPYAERYIALDTVAPTKSPITYQDSSLKDHELISEEMVITEINDMILPYQKATMHAYNSPADYERFCNSARKKRRLRVDRVIDPQIDSYHCIDFDINKETDFIVQSVEEKRVLASWFLRAPSCHIKMKWIQRLSLNILTDLDEM